MGEISFGSGSIGVMSRWTGIRLMTDGISYGSIRHALTFRWPASPGVDVVHLVHVRGLGNSTRHKMIR